MAENPKENPEERRSPLELIKRLDYPSGKSTFWERHEKTILRLIIAVLLLLLGILFGRGSDAGGKSEAAPNYKIIIVNSGSGEPGQIIDSIAKIADNTDDKK